MSGLLKHCFREIGIAGIFIRTECRYGFCHPGVRLFCTRHGRHRLSLHRGIEGSGICSRLRVACRHWLLGISGHGRHRLVSGSRCGDRLLWCCLSGHLGRRLRSRLLKRHRLRLYDRSGDRFEEAALAQLHLRNADLLVDGFLILLGSVQTRLLVLGQGLGVIVGGEELLSAFSAFSYFSFFSRCAFCSGVSFADLAVLADVLLSAALLPAAAAFSA